MKNIAFILSWSFSSHPACGGFL